MKTPGFNPATDTTPVAGFATFVNGLALSGGTPATNFNEYINWVRSKGKGTVGVPAPASVPDFMENHNAGKLRMVAVLGAKRQALLPEVPTFAELGLPGFEDLPYYGIWAPQGTPKAVIERYSEALAKVLTNPEVKERMAALGLTVGHMTPQQLDAREKAYTATWARIIKASGFQAQ